MAFRRHGLNSTSGLLPELRGLTRTFKVNNRHALTIALHGLGFAVFLWYFNPNYTCARFPTAFGKAALQFIDFLWHSGLGSTK
jgi:hypothetical protein